MPHRFLAVPLAIGSFSALTAPSLARAADFADDGTLLFDAAAVASFDFEGDVEADAGGPVIDDEAALSGTRSLVLAPFQGVELALDLPKAARSYRVSLWIHGGEVVGDLELSYHEDRVDEIGVLYPTGRVTSDGWVELRNDGLRVDGARLVSAKIGLFAAAGGRVDAIEIVADGELDASTGPLNPACKGAADASSCGVGQVCYWSECRNVNGWVPPIPADRDDVTRYLRRRLELLFGPFLERTIDLPGAQVALDGMAVADDPFAYWNGFLLAVRRLHDGHTTTSGIADFSIRNPKPLSICFLEGDADLSQDAQAKDALYLDVLVSHTGADHHLGLRPGDRLVSVDGQHPIAWARSLVGTYWGQPAISNHRTYAELASSMSRLLSRFADHIEVVHCDAETATCGARETISVADLPRDPEGTPFDGVACDNRPVRHLPTSPADHATGSSVYAGIVVESDATENIHGVEWESLYTSNGTDGVGAGLKAAVATWKSAGARGVILDHRTGTGGTSLGPKPLWDFTVQRHPADRYMDRQHDTDEQPTLAEGLAIFQKGVSSGDVEYIGSNSPTTSVPVALLVTEDVSASDWLPFGLKGAANTRIFGPYETNGAFSTRYSFGYWLGVGYVIAVGDTFAADGRTLNGTGVVPDEIVLPKQSDLMIGKDTVYEAALAWVRQGLAP